jgi:hypothetical protein
MSLNWDKARRNIGLSRERAYERETETMISQIGRQPKARTSTLPVTGPVNAPRALPLAVLKKRAEENRRRRVDTIGGRELLAHIERVRAVSREQFEETRRLVDGQPSFNDVGRPGFWIRLEHGRVVSWGYGA